MLWRSVWSCDGHAAEKLYLGHVPAHPILLEILWCVIFGRAGLVLPVWGAVDGDFGVMQRWPGCGICRAGRVSLWRGKQIPPLPHASACPSASQQKPLAVPVSSLAGMPVPSQYSPTVAQSGLATAPLCKSQYNPFYRTLVPVQRYYISSTSQYSCVDLIQLPVQHIRTCTGPSTAHYGSY